MNNLRRILFPMALCVFIAVPLAFQFISQVLQIPMDTKMFGYFDSYEKPTFTIDDYISGTFQTNYEDWVSHNLKPRNLLVKVYNQIQYSLFQQANNLIIGKNNVLFGADCVNEMYCLDGTDFSSPEKQQALEQFVSCIESLDRKLEAVDKHLIIYSTPSKAHWNESDIPERYRVQAVKGGVRSVDCFERLVEDTAVNYFDTKPILEECEYPIFYSTGLHWARPAEELVSVNLIDYLSEVSGKKHRNIILGDVESSEASFWRDDDGYSLLNLLDDDTEVTYYQYDIEREYPQEFDKVRAIVQGGSFSEGVLHDYFENYLGDEVYYINYANYITGNEIEGEIAIMNWNDLDMSYYLDQVDYVIVEMNESAIGANQSSGFIQYLNEFMDSYQQDVGRSCDFDANIILQPEVKVRHSNGFYSSEYGAAWISDDATVTLKNENITLNGLEIRYGVNEASLIDGENEIFIYVNQHLTNRIKVTESGEYTLRIAPENLPLDADNIYDIEIFTKNTFVPSEVELSEDCRVLALKLYYMGEMQ